MRATHALLLCVSLFRSVAFSRAEHADYLKKGLGTLAGGYVSLDASRPWLTYWISHSLELLGAPHALTGEAASDVVRFLGLCQSESGGFAGGPVPGQIPHLAPTYAAINTLVTIGTPEALQLIDRRALRAFLRRMKQPDGSFTMHHDGECDVRGVYIALSGPSALDVICHTTTTAVHDPRTHTVTFSCMHYSHRAPRVFVHGSRLAVRRPR